MAGKSTYLRTLALLVIMAQAGSFIPASHAQIGLCDKIYCRVGASDNLTQGESTFLVEMNETAYILNTATSKSIVIMDEVGRGTATNDGLSIAWAVSEELLDRIGCRTLFATHFHELSLLKHDRLKNYSMQTLNKNNKIIFMRKLIEGPALESFAIYVASLAGIKANVLDRAMSILDLLKERDFEITKTFLNEKLNNDEPKKIANHEDKKEKKIQNELKKLDLEAITPLEALNLLYTYRELLLDGEEKSGTFGKTSIKDKSSIPLSPSLFD